MIASLAKPIKYNLRVPGSKSLMNRALLCASLAVGRSVINDVVYCEDTLYMIDALKALGVQIRTYRNHVVVVGRGGKFKMPDQSIYIGNAGTVRRFLTPFVPEGSLHGNARMQQRPITDLLNALHGIKNDRVTISGHISSQFISALLMYAPTLPNGLTIIIKGKLVSAPYVQMTLQIMQHFGVSVQQRGNRFVVRHHNYRSANYTVEGDASSATYWWALAAITGSHITVENIAADTLQPDAKFKTLMQRMGCTVHGNTVIGPWDGKLKAVQVNMSDYPDAVMSAAVVMACAQGKSYISGIDHLRFKETDRLALLRKNLSKLATGKRVVIETENDHRFAMAFGILGLPVDNKQCVQKSYPTFWQDLKKMQQHSKQQTIVLTGMRGVGKTTYGKQLSKQYRAKFIDTDASLVWRGNWKKFRDQEHGVVKQVYRKTNTVISTGGGTLLFARNQRLLKTHYVVLLTAPLKTLKNRLAKQTHRPALTKGQTVLQELTTVWKDRQPKYLAIADNIYDCR